MPREHDKPPALVAWIAAALPALCAVLLAGSSMGHLDAPELASSAAGLGVTHPPGHPLWVIVHGLGCALVPIGPVAFRVAIVSAAWLAIVGRAALAVAWRATAPIDDRPELSLRWRSTLALGASLLATLGVAALRQSTRSEVYALAAALAVTPLALFATRAMDEGARARVSALCFALGLANHHFIALTTAPALAVAIAPRVRKSPRSLIPWAVALASALTLYAVLPLRAAAPASLARPRSIAEIVEVASARTFAKNTGSGVPDAAGVRVADVLDAIAQSLSSAGILAGIIGLALASRRASPLRESAAPLALVALVSIAARVWLGFTRDNPDAAGYLLPAVFVLAALSAHATRSALDAIGAASQRSDAPSKPVRGLLVLVLVLVPSALLPIVALAGSIMDTRTDRTHTSTTLALAPLVTAPPRAVLFAHGPNTIFRLRYAQLVEGERPDVTVVPVPLLAYPGMVSALIAKEPALAPVFARYLLQPGRAIVARDATSLATVRPVLAELDPDNQSEYVRYAIPSGPFATLLEAPTTLADVRAAAARHFVRYDQLAAQLNKEPESARESNEVLLWMAFNDAVFFAARGARPEARRAIERALEKSPNETRLHMLREALDRTPGDGPIDVTPVVPRS